MARRLLTTLAGMLAIVGLGIILGYTYPADDTLKEAPVSSWPEVTGLTSSPSPAPTPAPIDLDEVKTKLDNRDKVVLLDARSAADYRSGHIKGAISLPVAEFEERYPEMRESLPADAELIAYCTGAG